MVVSHGKMLKTFFFGITAFLYQKQNPVNQMVDGRQFHASLTSGHFLFLASSCLKSAWSMMVLICFAVIPCFVSTFAPRPVLVWITGDAREPCSSFGSISDPSGRATTASFLLFNNACASKISCKKSRTREEDTEEEGKHQNAQTCLSADAFGSREINHYTHWAYMPSSHACTFKLCA
jgi:hypothetical protein